MSPYSNSNYLSSTVSTSHYCGVQLISTVYVNKMSPYSNSNYLSSTVSIVE